MPDESSLREKACEKILSGRLPSTKPDRVFGGKGSGGTCAVCGRQLTQDDVDFEIEFNRHGSTPGLDRYYLHQRCFAAWEFERTRVEMGA